MFTGLIREVAKVQSYHNGELKVLSDYKPKVGDSIAINGVCLTVTKLFSNGFMLNVASETRSIVDESKFTGRVHMEPAMQMGDRFEGHIVQGHVDAVGVVEKIVSHGNGVDYYIKVPKEQIAYIVPKGSITIDGISLTVNDVFDDSFRLTIIPHTLENTLIKEYKIGTKVNIETDMFARYIEHILSHKKHSKKGLDWADIDAINMSY
jgi:riboflavin synthase